jgi:hypothetical protein
MRITTLIACAVIFTCFVIVKAYGDRTLGVKHGSRCTTIPACVNTML